MRNSENLNVKKHRMKPNSLHELLQNILIRNYILVFFVVFTVFIIPVLPADWHRRTYSIMFTCIYFLAALSMDRHRRIILIFAVAVILMDWVSEILGFINVTKVARILSILFFSLIVVNLIRMIASSKEVNQKVIIEAVNGYLLLSIVFGLLVYVLTIVNPVSFNFPALAEGNAGSYLSFSQPMYFSLVTTTTLGYGDIAPQTPVARSLATFMAVCGQFYIAIIIAMLIGKYLSKKS